MPIQHGPPRALPPSPSVLKHVAMMSRFACLHTSESPSGCPGREGAGVCVPIRIAHRKDASKAMRERSLGLSVLRSGLAAQHAHALFHIVAVGFVDPACRVGEAFLERFACPWQTVRRPCFRPSPRPRPRRTHPTHRPRIAGFSRLAAADGPVPHRCWPGFQTAGNCVVAMRGITQDRLMLR